MALLVDITNQDTDVVINYHKVSEVIFNKTIITIKVDSYVNLAARNKNVVSTSFIVINHDLSVDIGRKNAIQYAYELLRQQEMFSVAIDA